MMDKDYLFEIYKSKFEGCFTDFDSLKKEFDSMMLLKYEFMPYWWVCKLLDIGYDINSEEE